MNFHKKQKNFLHFSSFKLKRRKKKLKKKNKWKVNNFFIFRLPVMESLQDHFDVPSIVDAFACSVVSICVSGSTPNVILILFIFLIFWVFLFSFLMFFFGFFTSTTKENTNKHLRNNDKLHTKSDKIFNFCIFWGTFLRKFDEFLRLSWIIFTLKH